MRDRDVIPDEPRPPHRGGAKPTRLTAVGRYELLRVLGSGGMSKVYLARHRDTGQDVAVKILKPELCDRASALERFQVEFRAARKIFHPNVVRALDFGTDDGHVYLVLEYVDGPSLAEVLRDQRVLEESQATRWVRQVAEGLDQAHQQKLIHRDIKPGNILITPQGDAKLADLGLAKDLLAEKELTRTGTSLGTLLYMAPELYENARQADPRSDYYSLGVTYYQLLTGRFPFAGGQLTVLKNKFGNQFSRPRDLVPQLSPLVDDVVCRLLQADPEKRPANGAQFAELFQLKTAPPPAPNAIPAVAPPGSPPAAPPATQRRQDERYPTSIEGLCIPLLGPRSRQWKGAILDLSAGGARLKVERRFEVGSLVTVNVQPTEGEEVEFVLRVQWVQPEGSEWRFGGKFHRRLPPSDLERLLNRSIATVVIEERPEKAARLRPSDSRELP